MFSQKSRYDGAERKSGIYGKESIKRKSKVWLSLSFEMDTLNGYFLAKHIVRDLWGCFFMQTPALIITSTDTQGGFRCISSFDPGKCLLLQEVQLVAASVCRPQLKLRERQ